MKKVILFSLAVLLSFGLASCKKSKLCTCTYIGTVVDSGEWDDDEISAYNQKSEYPETIESGKCSDLDASAEGENFIGMRIKETRTCVEKK